MTLAALTFVEGQNFYRTGIHTKVRSYAKKKLYALIWFANPALDIVDYRDQDCTWSFNVL